MGILLLAAGKVEEEVLDVLKKNLSVIFKKKVSIGKGMPVPDYALDKERGQYASTPIINSIMDHKEYAHYERILGVFDGDLYAPGLNFIFGEAGAKAAIIALSRLREGFYGLPENKALFHSRVTTEAVHELGHTYGLGHCKHNRCVMFFSNSLTDTDRKGLELCPACTEKLGTVLI